jgi:hypothetical protein
MLQIFIALKNALYSAEFEPMNLGSYGKHATTRSLKAMTPHLTDWYNFHTSFYQNSDLK